MADPVMRPPPPQKPTEPRLRALMGVLPKATEPWGGSLHWVTYRLVLKWVESGSGSSFTILWSDAAANSASNGFFPETSS